MNDYPNDSVFFVVALFSVALALWIIHLFLQGV